MRYDALNLIGTVTELLQRRLDRLVDDFEHTSAGQQLVFHQGNIGFDSRRIAVHQKTDRACRGKYSDLRVAITVPFAELGRVVPDPCCFLFQMRELFCVRDLMHRAAMQLDHFQHRSDVVLRHRFRHTAGPSVAVSRERPHRSRHARALRVGFAGHDCCDRAAERPTFNAVVPVTVAHDQRAEIRVTKPERAEDVGILRDFLDRVTRVIDDDLLRGDENAHRGLEPLDVEGAICGFEFHQIERSEIARCVVEEKIFAARVGRILPASPLAGVPFVNGGVELHPRIAADVGALGNFAQKCARILAFARPTIGHVTRPPFAAFQRRFHEFIAHPHA